MKFVWSESLIQARDMLQSWTCSKDTGIPSFAKDTRTLSLNVLAATGFHRSYEFRGTSQGGNDRSRSYRDSLQTVLDNAIPLMLIFHRLLTFPLLPRSWVRVGEAAGEFKHYMMEMLDEEKSLLAQGRIGTGSLMTSFVRALNTQQEEQLPRANMAILQRVLQQTRSMATSSSSILLDMTLLQIPWHSVCFYLQQTPKFKIG